MGGSSIYKNCVSLAKTERGAADIRYIRTGTMQLRLQHDIAELGTCAREEIANVGNIAHWWGGRAYILAHLIQTFIGRATGASGSYE